MMEEAVAVSPDADDAMYFALAMKHNCAVWSNDKALKKQDKVMVFGTSELLRKLAQ